MINQDYKR